jgi:hypothetical protein
MFNYNIGQPQGGVKIKMNAFKLKDPLGLDFLQPLHFVHPGDFAQADHDLF